MPAAWLSAVPPGALARLLTNTPCPGVLPVGANARLVDSSCPPPRCGDLRGQSQVEAALDGCGSAERAPRSLTAPHPTPRPCHVAADFVTCCTVLKRAGTDPTCPQPSPPAPVIIVPSPTPAPPAPAVNVRQAAGLGGACWPPGLAGRAAKPHRPTAPPCSLPAPVPLQVTCYDVQATLLGLERIQARGGGGRDGLALRHARVL